MKHKTLKVNTKQFWTFSWHEIGVYDLPAMIDHALKTTNKTKIFYVGHSQGTTVLTVLLSMLPEYNDIIIQAHFMAPAVFMSNTPIQFFKSWGAEVMVLLQLINITMNI